MTPQIWHTQVPRISKYNQRLTWWAATLFFVGIAVVVGLVAGIMPERAFALAYSLIAASFGIMCLGMIQRWFGEPPALPSQRPFKFLGEWFGALFFDAYIFFAAIAAVLGLTRLITW